MGHIEVNLKNTCSDHIIINGERLDFDDIVNWPSVLSQGFGSLGETFHKNKPFPHLVFEGLFSSKLLDAIILDFDRRKWSDWARYNSAYEITRRSVPNTRLGTATQLYFDTIYSGRFLDFLSKVTGIQGLTTDPALFGGGMHEIPRGGRFEPHIDFNKHPVNMLDNSLVFITYLNKDWDSSYGGALELWDKDENRCVVKVEPIFGRSILFFQTPASLHGHPDPVNAPEGRTRRSVAAYYYTNRKPGLDAQKPHHSLYARHFDAAALVKMRANVRNFVPPILYDLAAGTKRFLLGQ